MGSSVCTRCVLEFQSPEEMRIHRGLQHEGKYACMSCKNERYFGKKNGLEDHLKRAHKQDLKSKSGEIQSALARMESAIARMMRNGNLKT